MSSEQTGSTPSSSGEGRVFLVVDDDPMVRKIVTRGLSQLDPAEVLEEEDGLAAQEVLRKRRVDVVVTDVVMPNMDGLALMKWAQEHCPEPLWIVLSGLDTFDAAVEALQLGAFDYLAKPPEVPRVRVAVRNALDQIELMRERKRLYAELEESNVKLAEKVDQLQTVCHVLEDQAATIQADLDRAEVIQRALLPQQPPVIPGWCMETLYSPGSSVGGDFYNTAVLNDQYLALVIADAAGHGVAAAMLSVLFKLRLRHRDDEGSILPPQQVLEALNRSLFDMLSTPGAFITAAVVLIDLDSGQGRLASAGHPPCVVSARSGEPLMLERTGAALGLERDAPYSEHEFELKAGDRLMLYTDGILDGGPDSPAIGDLANGMASVPDRAALLGDFYQNAISNVGSDRDDITMLLLQRGDGESHFADAAAAKGATPETAQHTPSPAQPHIAAGAENGHGFIALMGSVTWLCSHALLETATLLLEGHARLTLDLQQCEHLDSTCLGTLHEIVTSHPDATTLQGVSSEVRKLFEELSMSAVLAHIHSETSPLPAEMTILDTARLTPQQQGARILSAHETLASLSDENRDQFRAVLDSLRADLSK